MTLLRVCTFVILLFVAMDYSDPSLPGVFSFDTAVFYLDGVVDARCAATPATPLPTPMAADRLIAPQRMAVCLVVEAASLPVRFHSRVTRRDATRSSDARSEDH